MPCKWGASQENANCAGRAARAVKVETRVCALCVCVCESMHGIRCGSKTKSLAYWLNSKDFGFQLDTGLV